MPIKQDRALELFSEINAGLRLKGEDSEKIFEVFSALSRWNAHLIENRVNWMLNELDSNGQIPTDTSTDELSSLIFNGAFIDRLSKQDALIEKQMDHDCESWIDSASELLASSIILKMEGYIVREGMPSTKERLAFGKKIDFEKCEVEVNSTLKEALAYMNTAIDQRLGMSSESAMK